MIGVAKKSTMIFKELVNKGYVDEEVPLWIERDEESAQSARGRSSEGTTASQKDVTTSQSDVEDEEQTRKSLFVAPNVPTGKGTLSDDPTLRHDPRAITLTTSTNLDAATQQRLRDANIVQLPDGTGRWMKVDENIDGSINMTPVDMEAFLRTGPVDDGEMPTSPEISAMAMEELKIRTNAIM